ncbi:MAG: hypothetical protein KAS64_01435 [Spirochaetes bacterium]|nr:hypothetical protein [Spirochaetota bacterium]
MFVTKYVLVLMILLFTIVSCAEGDDLEGVWQSYDNPPYVAQYQFESSSYTWTLFLTNSSSPTRLYGISGNFRVEGANIFFTPASDYILTNSVWSNASTTNIEVSAPHSISDNVMILDIGNGYSNYNKFAP